jgi:hypothetical protein
VSFFQPCLNAQQRVAGSCREPNSKTTRTAAKAIIRPSCPPPSTPNFLFIGKIVGDLDTAGAGFFLDPSGSAEARQTQALRSLEEDALPINRFIYDSYISSSSFTYTHKRTSRRGINEGVQRKYKIADQTREQETMFKDVHTMWFCNTFIDLA